MIQDCLYVMKCEEFVTSLVLGGLVCLAWRRLNLNVVLIVETFQTEY